MRSNKVAGKKYYMAPEVAAGDMYDPVQADSWSLGIILYALLTGTPLFGSAETGDESFDFYCRYGLFALIQTKSASRKISEEIMSLLATTLHYNPSERISARGLAIRLPVKSK